MFDRILSAEDGGYFSITPTEPFSVERGYWPDSNVARTLFTTEKGSVRLTESLNSGNAGRLPWSELARRLYGVSGEVEFDIVLRPGIRADTVSPWFQQTIRRDVFHVATLMVMLKMGQDVVITERSDRTVRAHGVIGQQRSVLAANSCASAALFTGAQTSPEPAAVLPTYDAGSF